MISMNIDTIYNGISINIEISNRVNALVGNSGTGKTLLMKAIQLYCLRNNIRHIYCNSDIMSLSSKQILEICSDKCVVLLDNADLYLNNELLSKIKSSEDVKVIIICMKDTSKINMYEVSEYIVKYSDKKITIREI